MKTDFDKEFEEFQNDKKDIIETLEFEKEQYAKIIKNGFGSDILQELSNPSLKPIKHSRKQRFNMWWEDIKIKMNNYFFN